MNRALGTVFALILFSSVSLCQSPTPAASPLDTEASIAEAVRAFAIQQSVPGISWAVVADGRTLAGTYGSADLENDVPVTKDALFRIGSISKSFTATLIARMAEQGSLSLTDSVQKNCPAYPQKQWPITIAQVLSHQGGIRHYQSGAEFYDTRHFDSVTASVSIVAQDPLGFEPGTKFTYSSYGYNLLGCDVEGATKTPYFEALQTQVLAPLKLTHVVVDDVRPVQAHRVRGYTLVSKAIANAVFVDTTSKIPGGGLLATASDVAQFGHDLSAGKLLGAKQRDAMWTEQLLKNGASTNYAMGWRVGSLNSQREIYHGGDSSGFCAMLYILPDSNVSIAVLANLDQIGDARLVLVRKIAQIFKGRN